MSVMVVNSLAMTDMQQTSSPRDQLKLTGLPDGEKLLTVAFCEALFEAFNLQCMDECIRRNKASVLI